MSEAEELVALPAVELRRRIGARQLSPVALLDACVARIGAVNPAVNAVTATCYARARAEAERAEAAVGAGEALGPLHGLPLAVKDLEDTEGLLTTRGSPLLRDNVPAADAISVARLRAAGAIVVGKTNVPEWGAGANSRNPVWGATGNPFNPTLNAGGSSGGSAVALACDMVPLATGSDTGGSLRIPAALSGVVGFRPSAGMVPSERRQHGWTPISVLGPMGRTVADTRLQFDAIIGPDDRDPLTHPKAAGRAQPVDLSTLRVAYTEDFGICPVDSDIRVAFRKKLDALRPLVATCDPLAVEMGEADRCFDVIRAVNYLTGYSEAYEKDPDSLGANVRANYEIGAAMSLADFAWAHREQTQIFRRFQEIYHDYDVVLAPVTPVSPFPWTQLYADEIDGVPARNYYHWLGLTYVVTLTTNPALSLPCGLDGRGMPFGLQVIGRHLGDARLLDCAEAMEAASAEVEELRRPRPELTALRQPTAELRSIVTAPPPAALVRDDRP